MKLTVWAALAAACVAGASCDGPHTKAPAAGASGASARGGVAQDGPFGLAMGTPMSALQVVKPLDGDSRYKITPPLTNDEFEEYIAYAPSSTGLCRISGIGVTHHGDATGAKIRDVLARFTTALDAKYGAHRSQDTTADTAPPQTADGFAAAVDQEQRLVQTEWSAGAHSRLPETIEQITAYVKAVDADGTYLQVTYLFTNYDRCRGHDATSSDVGKAL